MPKMILFYGYLVLAVLCVTADSFSTRGQQLTTSNFWPTVFYRDRRREDPLFIVELEDHNEHVQEDFQSNAKEKYKYALPSKSFTEVPTAETSTYSENDVQILEIKEEKFKVKRAATKNTPKSKKKAKLKSKPTIKRTNKKLTKNTKTVPKNTKNSPPAKSRNPKKKQTTKKTAKEKLSKNNKKPLKSPTKNQGKRTKQIKKNAKTTKAMKKSSGTKRKYIMNTKLATVKRTKPTNKKGLTTVKRRKANKKQKNNNKPLKPSAKNQGKPIKQIEINTKTTKAMKNSNETKRKYIKNTKLKTVKRTKPSNKKGITTVKITKPLKKMALKTVKRAKPTNKMVLPILKRTNLSKKTVLTTIKTTKTITEIFRSVTKKETSSVKAAQNNSSKNFYRLFKIKTKQKITENGEVIRSTRNFPVLQDLNENTFMDKYQEIFSIKSRRNEVHPEGKLFKLEEERKGTTEIIKRTKLTEKTAITTKPKSTNKEMAKITGKTITPTVETFLSVTKKEIPAVEKRALSNTSKSIYGLFKMKKKQMLPENSKILGITKNFSLLQEFSWNTSMDKYQRVYPIKPRKSVDISTGKLFNLEELQTQAKDIEIRTKSITRMTTKPTNKTSLKVVKRTKSTTKMALTTVNRTKFTKGMIAMVAKEKIPFVENVTQHYSTKNLYGFFKIKTKRKPPENSEVLDTTITKFPSLTKFNGNTLMSKYQEVFT